MGRKLDRRNDDFEQEFKEIVKSKKRAKKKKRLLAALKNIQKVEERVRTSKTPLPKTFLDDISKKDYDAYNYDYIDDYKDYNYGDYTVKYGNKEDKNQDKDFMQFLAPDPDQDRFNPAKINKSFMFDFKTNGFQSNIATSGHISSMSFI